METRITYPVSSGLSTAVVRRVHGPKDLFFLGASPSSHDEALRKLEAWNLAEQPSEVPSEAQEGLESHSPPALTLLPQQLRTNASAGRSKRHVHNKQYSTYVRSFSCTAHPVERVYRHVNK